jgi:hypothetical protein
MGRKNYICSTYLNKSIDIQRKTRWDDNDFKYIKEWLYSALNHSLNCVIIHDNLSPEFVKRYENKESYIKSSIEFIKAVQPKLNGLDYRWILYYEFLELYKNEIDMILFTDISDVVFLKNPFDFMSKNSELIYTADEEGMLKNGWILKRNKYFYDIIPNFKNYEKENAGEKLKNCGVVGGKVEVLLEFVKDMASILLAGNVEETTVDMSVLNYLLYTKYKNKSYSGYPLNTRFKFNEINPNCYIKHK